MLHLKRSISKAERLVFERCSLPSSMSYLQTYRNTLLRKTMRFAACIETWRAEDTAALADRFGVLSKYMLATLEPLVSTMMPETLFALFFWPSARVQGAPYGFGGSLAVCC